MVDCVRGWFGRNLGETEAKRKVRGERFENYWLFNRRHNRLESAFRRTGNGGRTKRRYYGLLCKWLSDYGWDCEEVRKGCGASEKKKGTSEGLELGG